MPSKNIEIFLDKNAEGGHQELYAMKSIDCEGEEVFGLRLQDLMYSTTFLKEFDFVLHTNFYTIEFNEKKKICRINFLTELADSNLADEIYVKRSKKVNYNKAELYTFAQNLFKVFSELEKKGIIHGNLKPENILFVKSKLKISDFSIDEKKNLNNKYSKKDFKNDAFSCGVIILECLFLDEGEFKFEKIEEYLKKIENKVDFWFFDLIKKLLNDDNNEKISIQKACEIINEHQDVK